MPAGDEHRERGARGKGESMGWLCFSIAAEVRGQDAGTGIP